MHIRLDVEVSNDELKEMVSRAVRLGFKRAEPRKGWTLAEYKEAARFWMVRVVERELAS